MGYFPLFIDLSGKEVLVAGGGKVAERKVRILREFDAAVRLVSPEAAQELTELAGSGKIRLLPREYRAEDMDAAVLVVAATGDREVNRRIHGDAVRKGIPVNVVDDPELCTFFFPAVIHRNDLVVGITTSGSYPALSRYARKKIETLFPEEYGMLTDILKGFRQKVRDTVPGSAERAAILNRLLDEAARAVAEEPDRNRVAGLLEEKYEELTGKEKLPGGRSRER